MRGKRKKLYEAVLEPNNQSPISLGYYAAFNKKDARARVCKEHAISIKDRNLYIVPVTSSEEPLITNRHTNAAAKALGTVYRVSTNPPNKYPEIGAVEAMNAQKLLADAYARIEYLAHKYG